jgi:hypothetical protein
VNAQHPGGVSLLPIFIRVETQSIQCLGVTNIIDKTKLMESVRLNNSPIIDPGFYLTDYNRSPIIVLATIDINIG